MNTSFYPPSTNFNFHLSKKRYPVHGLSNRKSSGIHTTESDLIREFTQKDRDLLFKDEALEEISSGRLPDIRMICHQLYRTFFVQGASHTAMQFIPVLSSMPFPGPDKISHFIRNEKTNHVLVQNEWLKVVLIHWRPGKYSDIHGHPAGGCVFRVLQGRIEEKRYTTGSNPELLAESTYSKGSMAYIDDRMAYHAVGNPFNESAISLHVYTPGIKKVGN